MTIILRSICDTNFKFKLGQNSKNPIVPKHIFLPNLITQVVTNPKNLKYDKTQIETITQIVTKLKL